MTHRYSRRQFIRYSAYAGSAVVVLGACSDSGDGTTAGNDVGGAGATSTTDASGLGEIGGAELVTDRSDFPSRFKERPEFADMVEAGTLPPVEERIGEDPLVLRPLEGIGAYGGTIRSAMTDPADVQAAARFAAGPDSLLFWDNMREEVVPNLALDFELSDDFTELILHLRHGMKWSDGAPFTADDILFWRNDMSLMPGLPVGGTPSLRINNQDVVVEKVDDFTVRYKAPAPHPLLPHLLASGSSRDVGGLTINGQFGQGGFAPKHYLSQFHPTYVTEAAANAVAAEAGLPGWVKLFQDRASFNLNPELPLLTPWITTRPANDPPWQLAPNPYSIWVDTDGNQLPYIGEITMDLVESRDVVVLRTSQGEFDFQHRNLDMASLPVLIENEQRGDYTVHRTPRDQMDFGLWINFAYDLDPVLRDLLHNVDFRRALSLGIDRDQVNEGFFLGLSTPSATMPSDTSPYFPGEEWRTKWATHDPDQANELLDGIGLTQMDGGGFRIRPDGSGRIRLEYEAIALFADFPGIGEMIKRHWADIGIDMNVTENATNLMQQRQQAGNQIMLSGHQVGTDDPFLSPSGIVLNGRSVSSTIGVPYINWYASGGKQGVEPPDSLRELKEATELHVQGQQADEEERIEIGKELFMRHADNVWTIGIVGFGMAIQGYYVAKNSLRNVPGRVLSNEYQRSPSNAFPMTFYYE